MARFATVHRRPSGRHRAPHVEDGQPFEPEPQDETLADEVDGTPAVEDEAR